MRVSEYNRDVHRRLGLVGYKCNACGFVTATHREVCPDCGNKELEEVKLSRRGKIVSFTVVRFPPLEFKGQEPYAIAMVQLEDGCLVVGPVTDCKPEDVKDGAEVEVVHKFIRGEEGILHYAYKFRLVG